MNKKIIATLVLGLTLSVACPTLAATIDPVDRVSKAMEDAKTFYYKIDTSNTIKISDSKTKKTEEMQIKAKVAGVSLDKDKKKSGNEDNAFMISLEARGGKIKKSLGAESVGLEFEYKGHNKDSYLKLNRFPSILYMFVDLDPIKSQWIKFSNKEAKSLTPSIIKNEFGDEDATKTNPDLEKKKKALDKKYKTYYITKKLPNTVLEKEKVERYTFRIDQKEIIKRDIELAKLEGRPKDQASIKDKEDLWKKVKVGQGELLINKKNSLIQISVPFSFADKKGNESYSVESKLTVTLKDINSPKIKVELPKKFITTEQVKKLLEKE